MKFTDLRSSGCKYTGNWFDASYVCKAAKSNSTLKLIQTNKSYHLKTKTVALKVMCNGEDLISFAESNGAYKTAEKLQNSIGNVTITDLAALSKVNVTF